MKHRGDNAPLVAFMIEDQPKKSGYVLVRFYENVVPFSEAVGDITISGYEYDEYRMEMKSYGKIHDDIQNNLAALLTQAKLAEAEQNIIPALEAQVSRLKEENAHLKGQVVYLDGQVVDTQLALCDVFEIMMGG